MTIQYNAPIAQSSSSDAAMVKSRTRREAMEVGRCPTLLDTRACGKGSALFEDITHAANGMYQLLFKWIIHLRAQAAHHHIHDVRAGIEVNVPDLLNDVGA